MNHHGISHRVLHERSCCDGLCMQGRDCPAIRAAQERAAQTMRLGRLAPGVIEVHRCEGRVRRAVRAVLGWLAMLRDEVCR